MNTNRLVSVLVMSTRERYLGECLDSILSQTVKEIEIIIGDNTPDKKIIEKFKNTFEDKRVTWVHSYPITKGSATAHFSYLLSLSRTKYTRYVFDDDLLNQYSTEYLLSIIENHGFAYHGRHFVDNTGNITLAEPAIRLNDPFLIELKTAISTITTRCINIFGEPSFCLFRTDILKSVKLPHVIKEMTLVFLGDVMNILTCPDIFEPASFRDNGSSHLRSSDEASEVYGRADRSNIARGG